MPTNITEAATFDSPCSVPTDGDPVNAASLTAAGTGFQVLADRTQYIVVGAQGSVIGNTNFYWSAADTIRLDPRSMLLSDGTSARWLAVTGTINASGMSNSTWYYIYVYTTDLSTIAFDYNTRAPTNLQYDPSHTTHRYIGCFVTSTTGHIVPFMSVHGHYTYLISGISTSSPPFQFGLNHAQATFLPLDLSHAIPPHVIQADFNIFLSNSDVASDLFFRIRTFGITTGYSEFSVGAAVVDQYNNIGMPFCVSLQQVEYEFPIVGAGANDGKLIVTGFYE